MHMVGTLEYMVVFLTTIIIIRKQTLEGGIHLEVKVLRPDKMKTHLEAVVNNQERGGSN